MQHQTAFSQVPGLELTILGVLIQNIKKPLTRTTPAWLRHAGNLVDPSPSQDGVENATRLVGAAVLRVQETTLHWVPKVGHSWYEAKLKYNPRAVTSHVTDQRCEGKPARCRGTEKSNSFGEIGSSRGAVTYRPSAPATNKSHPRALGWIGQLPRGGGILVGKNLIRASQ